MNLKAYIKTVPVIAACLSAPIAAFGQSIVHNAGSGDLTFFYDSAADSFDVVFRSKEDTQATGLDQEYAGAPGGVGDPGSGQQDWNFDTLQANLTSAPQVSVGGTDYYVSPASGSIYEDSSSEPDLGLRFRFREDDDGTAVDQFESFTMTLDWDNSTRPEGAEFALFGFDEFDEPTIVRYETIQENFAEDWSVWGHDHWHWGFSEQGEYSLVFDFVGEFADGGLSTVGSTTVDFQVIPEPGTVALLFGLGAFAVVSVIRLRRSKS